MTAPHSASVTLASHPTDKGKVRLTIVDEPSQCSMVLDLTDAGFADLLTASKPRPVGMISYSDPALIGYMESNTTFEHVDLPNDLHAAKTEPRLVTIRKWAADLAASWDEFTKSSGVMTRSSACFDHADTWIEQNGGPALKFQRTFFDKLPD